MTDEERLADPTDRNTRWLIRAQRLTNYIENLQAENLEQAVSLSAAREKYDASLAILERTVVEQGQRAEVLEAALGSIRVHTCECNCGCQAIARAALGETQA